MTTKKKSSAGRPRGARNKLNAQDEIKKALNRGTGLVELKQFLWDMMQDPKVSELQKAKFTQMYLDVMKYIHTENLKLEHEQQDPEESKQKDIQQGEHTEAKTSDDVGNVARISFGKK